MPSITMRYDNYRSLASRVTAVALVVASAQVLTAIPAAFTHTDRLEHSHTSLGKSRISPVKPETRSFPMIQQLARDQTVALKDVE